MVSLDDDTADATARGDPDIMVLILSDTADIVIAESLFLRQVVQGVVLHVEDIQSLTRTDPEESSGVLQDLGDIVIGERLQVGDVTREDGLVRRGEVQNYQSLCRSDIQVVAPAILVVVQAGDVVGIQFPVLTGVGREGVHLRVIDLEAAVGGDPEVADLVCAEGIDVVVDECGRTVLGQ